MKQSGKSENLSAPREATAPITGPTAQTNKPSAESAGQNSKSERREPGPDRRLSLIERRIGVERRQKTIAKAGPERRISERRGATNLERRRGPGRRLSDDRRAAEEGEMTPEQFEFIKAIEAYKKVNKRMYPTWTEILEVVQQLGYRKVIQRDIKLENVPEPTLSKVA